MRFISLTRPGVSRLTRRLCIAKWFVAGVLLASGVTAIADSYVQSYQGARADRAGPECQWRLSARDFTALPSDTRHAMTGRGCSHQIHVEGQIDPEDGPAVARLIEHFDAADQKSRGSVDYPVILLDSTGGSVTAAIEIGRAIRSSSSMRAGRSTGTLVLQDEECSSACVLILAASYRRGALAGQIGIHRPFFIGKEYERWGYDDYQTAYEALRGRLATLLSEWNVPASLLDAMYSVPSETLQYLDEEELFRYRLNQDDLIFAERRNAEYRRVCGPDAPGYMANDPIGPAAERCRRKVNAARAELARRAREICGEDAPWAVFMLPGSEAANRCLERLDDQARNPGD